MTVDAAWASGRTSQAIYSPATWHMLCTVRAAHVRRNLVRPKVLEPDFVEKSTECDAVKIVIASRRTVSLPKALVSQTEDSDYEFNICAQRFLVREGSIWRTFVWIGGDASCIVFGCFRSDIGALAGRALLIANRRPQAGLVVVARWEASIATVSAAFVYCAVV